MGQRDDGGDAAADPGCGGGAETRGRRREARGDGDGVPIDPSEDAPVTLAAAARTISAMIASVTTALTRCQNVCIGPNAALMCAARRRVPPCRGGASEK